MTVNFYHLQEWLLPDSSVPGDFKAVQLPQQAIVSGPCHPGGDLGLEIWAWFWKAKKAHVGIENQILVTITMFGLMVIYSW